MSEHNGDDLPNGFRELPGDGDGERNPTEPPQPYETDRQGRRLCGAKCRGKDKTCRAPAMQGSNRCRLHGGLTPGGMASPHFKHGRRSKYMKDIPPKLKAGYRAALKDPELHSLDEDIALLTTRVGELLCGLATGDPSTYDAVWNNIKDTVSHKCRLVLTEHRRQLDLNVMLSVTDLVTLLNAILHVQVEVVESEVKDTAQANRIIAKFTRETHKLLNPKHTDVIEHHE